MLHLCKSRGRGRVHAFLSTPGTASWLAIEFKLFTDLEFAKYVRWQAPAASVGIVIPGFRHNQSLQWLRRDQKM